GRLAAKMAGVPVIVTTEHSADPRPYRSRFQIMLDTRLGRVTSKIIAVSKRVREHHLSTQSYRDSIFAVIHNGVDLEKFSSSGDSSISLKKKALGIDPSAPVIGNIGRLVPQKRQDLFLEVMAAIVKQRPRAVGLIVGDGHLRAPLESQVEALGLEQNIIFTGARGDIPELLHTMDALVMTSEQEGFSMTILEAMAAGVPVVATDVGGNAEVLEHGVNGFLHPFGDHAGITESVLKILGDRTLSRIFSAAGRSTVESSFTSAHMIEATESLYEELLPPTSA
ncbi:MAG: glycosyltransferase, partial [Candidatus Marinimicrobia bacterium]|nr:glycosyltransferase [Candidatus Neomarinimicrobiota bacterium]